MHSKQSTPISYGANTGNRPSGEAVRLAVGEGRWMSVQQAIVVTGLTERTLRRHIKRGWVKSRRNGNRSNSPLELWITPEVSNFAEHEESDESDIVEVFDAAPTDTDQQSIEVDGSTEAEQTQWTVGMHGSSAPAAEIESIMRTITSQFLERLDQSNQAIIELKTELQDKDRQLKLLPDLQKQSDERQLLELKSIALEKQIEELKQLNEQLRLEAEQAKEKPQKKGWWAWLMGADRPQPGD